MSVTRVLFTHGPPSTDRHSCVIVLCLSACSATAFYLVQGDIN